MVELRKTLTECSPVFYSRFLEAVVTQPIQEDFDGVLHDPIEDRAEFAEAMQIAEQIADIELEPKHPREERRMGYCHVIWITKKRILREKYDIEWFSPYELNPHIIFG